MEAQAIRSQNRQVDADVGRGGGVPAVRWLGYVAIILIGIAVLESVALLHTLDDRRIARMNTLHRSVNTCGKFSCLELQSAENSKPLTEIATPPPRSFVNEDSKPLIIALFFAFSVVMVGSSGSLYLFKRGARNRADLAPVLSAEQLAAIDRANREAIEAEQDKEYYKLVRREVRQLKKDVPMFLSTLTKLDYDVSSYGRSRAKPKKRKKDLVKFEWIGITKTEVWFKIDGFRLPYGVSFLKLKDPDVTENLKHGINRPCLWHTDNMFNVFLRVGLKSGHLGVPTFVNWLPDPVNERVGVDHKMPAVKSNSFVVPVGVDATGRLITQDLIEWPHGLVLGATGRGKTSILLLWLAVLMQRHTPKHLKFYLIDLKKAAFPRFARLPHVQELTTETDRAVELLEQAVALIESRNSMFSELAYDIDDWNKKFSHRFQHRLFVFVDELSLIMQSTDKDIARRAVTSILRIVQLGRSCGVHLILGTQTVNKHVLRHEITGNIEGRVVYHVKGKSSSILAIGSDDASELHLPGRAIYDRRGFNMVVQSPFATNNEIDQMLANIMDDDGGQVDDLGFWRVALDRRPMNVSWRGMYDELGGKWGKVRIQKFLKEWEFTPKNEFPIFVIDDEEYILLSNGEYTDRALIPAIPEIVAELIAELTPVPDPVAPAIDDHDQVVIEGQYMYETSEVPVTTETALLSVIYHNMNGIAYYKELETSDTGLSLYQLRKTLKELEFDPSKNNVHVIDDKRFILTPSLMGFAPRYLLPVNGHLPASKHELNVMARKYWIENHANRKAEPEL